MKMLFTMYQVFRGVRYQILHTTFGFVSHCNHTPTCGSQFVSDSQKNGVVSAIISNTRRVLTCY